MKAVIVFVIMTVLTCQTEAACDKVANGDYDVCKTKYTTAKDASDVSKNSFCAGADTFKTCVKDLTDCPAEAKTLIDADAKTKGYTCTSEPATCVEATKTICTKAYTDAKAASNTKDKYCVIADTYKKCASDAKCDVTATINKDLIDKMYVCAKHQFKCAKCTASYGNGKSAADTNDKYCKLTEWYSTCAKNAAACDIQSTIDTDLKAKKYDCSSAGMVIVSLSLMVLSFVFQKYL